MTKNLTGGRRGGNHLSKGGGGGGQKTSRAEIFFSGLPEATILRGLLIKIVLIDIF